MNIVENTIVFTLSEDNSFTQFTKKNNVKNFIANLNGVSLDLILGIKDKFITFGHNIENIGGSFVIVSEFSFDDDLIIVPTLQEAYDYIEMEEIERQLKL